jgi:ribosomal protein S18 acetylase RimI-like enzyme
MSIDIHLATPGDETSIASLLHEAFLAYRPSYTPEGFSATTPSSDTIRARFDEGPVWVAVDGAAIVGTVSALPQGEAIYIRSLAVLPTARGQGVGRALLRTVEEYASEHGFARLTLSTTPFLSSAIRLYEGFSYHRSEEGPQDLFGTPLFSMAKVLKIL